MSNGIDDSFVPVYTDSILHVQPLAAEPSNELVAIYDKLNESISKSFDKIQGDYKITSLKDLFKDPQNFAKAMGEHLTAVADAFKVALAEAKTLPEGERAEAVKALANQMGAYAGRWAEEALGDAQMLLKNTGAAIDDASKKLREDIGKSVEALHGNIKGYAEKVSKNLKTFLKENPGFQEGLKSVQEGLDGVAALVEKHFKEFNQGAEEFFKDLGEHTPKFLKEMGKYIDKTKDIFKQKSFFGKAAQFVGEHKIATGAGVAAAVVAAVAFSGGDKAEKHLDERMAREQEPAAARA